MAPDNTLDTVLSVRQGLRKAIDLLVQRRFKNPSEAQDIIQKERRLRAEKLYLDADIEAHIAKMSTLQPPSQGQVARIKAATEDIYILTAESNTADEIVSAATQILTALNEWKTTPAPASP